MDGPPSASRLQVGMHGDMSLTVVGTDEDGSHVDE